MKETLIAGDVAHPLVTPLFVRTTCEAYVCQRAVEQQAPNVGHLFGEKRCLETSVFDVFSFGAER